MTTPAKDDDLPEGLRNAAQVNYGIGKRHDDGVKPVQTAKPAPAKAATGTPENKVPAAAQAFRDEDAVRILNVELQRAEQRLSEAKTKDEISRAQGDVAGVQREIQRAQGKNPLVASLPQDAASSPVEPVAIQGDELAPGLNQATTVDYGPTTNTTVAPTNQFVPDRVKYEAGVGAAAGAYTARKQAKAANAQIDAQYAHLPPEMRPVNPASLQRYINSQFSVQIPLEKLKQLTGMDIRTMSEVQAARRLVEGSEMSREPVVKDVNGRKTTVSYRTTPAVPPINISMFPSPSLMSRVGDAVSSGAKSFASGAANMLRPVIGGAVAAPQLMEAGTDYLQKRPVDPTQVISGVGGLGMMTRSTPLGVAGGLAQIPYAIKHREELARAMTMHDINPTAFPLGSPGADEPLVPRQ
jgi:hypothetical protein